MESLYFYAEYLLVDHLSAIESNPSLRHQHHVDHY